MNGASRSWSALEDGEHPVAISDESLWRQVNPQFYDDSQKVVADLAFRARPEEGYKLSVSRSSVVADPEDAYGHHTTVAGRASVGVAAVTVREVDEAGSRVVDDASIQTIIPPTPGHCYVDCRGLTKSERQELREELAIIATDRGLVYGPIVS